ncbi:MAG: peptidoglycan DD-metalloendopeptidase family protein [Acutalibacteraceae bacterium]
MSKKQKAINAGKGDSSSIRYYIPRNVGIRAVTGSIALIAFIIHFIFDVLFKLIETAVTKSIVFTAHRIKSAVHTVIYSIKRFFIGVYSVAHDCVCGFKRNCDAIHNVLFSGLVRYDTFKALVSKAWSQKKTRGISTAFKLTGKEIYNKRRYIASAFNVILPAIAIGIFALTLNHLSGQEYGLQLLHDGQSYAVVKNATVFENATSYVLDRLEYYNSNTSNVNILPTYRLTTMDEGSFSTAKDVSDLLIEYSSDSIEEACGFYYDGELIGAVKTEDELNSAINKLKKDTLKSFKKKSSYSNIEAVFAKSYDIISGLYPTDIITTGEQLIEILKGNESITSQYTTVEGDTMDSIAAKTGISKNTLIKLNPALHSITDEFLPNTKIVTSSRFANVVIQVTADHTYNEAIPYTTETTYDDDEYVDYLVVTREGVDGKQICVDKLTFENGKLVKTKKGTRTVTKKPISKKQIKGTIEYLYGYSYGEFIWPVPYTRNITSYFAERWGRMHRGIDIAISGCYGQDIVAADGGVVEEAYYVWDYGNHVIINHGNGVRTLYAHASELYVSEGDLVYRGQPIAAIGDTGDSYGAHLHFEVRINDGDNRVDPLNYL